MVTVNSLLFLGEWQGRYLSFHRDVPKAIYPPARLLKVRSASLPVRGTQLSTDWVRRTHTCLHGGGSGSSEARPLLRGPEECQVGNAAESLFGLIKGVVALEKQNKPRA